MLVAVLGQLALAIDGAERRALERGTGQWLVRIPAILADEVLMLGGWVGGRVVPLKLKVAVLDFSQLPAIDRLHIQGLEPTDAATGNLAVFRALQRRAAYTVRKAFEGLTHALRLVLRTATAGVHAFLAQQGTRRWLDHEAVGGGSLRSHHRGQQRHRGCATGQHLAFKHSFFHLLLPSNNSNGPLVCLFPGTHKLNFIALATPPGRPIFSLLTR
ncbi:hypothetical protein D3C77_353030 [compost metagenome]